MPSVSHRTSLDEGAPRRAERGSAALGNAEEFIGGLVHLIGAPVRWCSRRLEDWRALRQLRDLDDHLLRDIGLTAAEVNRSTIFPRLRNRHAQDPKGPPSWPTTS